MIEVERKRQLDGDTLALEIRLADSGYREVGTHAEVDTYYSRPDRDFLETVECLRVREREGFAEITYKPASDASTHRADGIIAKRETNVVLDGAEQATVANDLLVVLGMVRLCRVDKRRRSYQDPDRPWITIALDQISGVGSFVETEIMSTNQDWAVARLDEVEQQLGLVDLPVVTLPYRDLVLQSEQGD